MQLAGQLCAICKGGVLLEGDATWCAQCSTVIHRACLAEAANLCPKCNRAYDPPEVHFVFSQQCPECFRRNLPAQPCCLSCNARTRWDSQKDYETFLVHMKDTSRIYLLRGIAEIVVGFICALIVLLVMFSMSPRIGLAYLVLGFIVLTSDGIYRLFQSRKISKFR